MWKEIKRKILGTVHGKKKKIDTLRRQRRRKGRTNNDKTKEKRTKKNSRGDKDIKEMT